MQQYHDKVNEKKEQKRIQAEIDKNRKRLVKMKADGKVVLPSITKGIDNLKNIKNMYKRSGRAKELIDQAQKDFERRERQKSIRKKQNIQFEAPKPIVIYKEKGRAPDLDFDPLKEPAQVDTDSEEEKAYEPKAKKKRPKRQTKASLFARFREAALRVKRLHRKVEKTEGEDLDRVLRDLDIEVKDGKGLATQIRAKKYKNMGTLKIAFFDQIA